MLAGSLVGALFGVVWFGLMRSPVVDGLCAWLEAHPRAGLLLRRRRGGGGGAHKKVA